MSSWSEKDLAEEQEFVGVAYERLDALRVQAEGRLATTLRGDGEGGTKQARGERDSTAAMYAEQVAQFNAVESGLCFGRLDFADGGVLHIGRIGLSDEEFEPMLIDWRAPIARPFYLATAANPDGVRRRRHVRTLRRRVVGLDDEVLDLEEVGDERTTLTGEAALLAALGSARTGRMRDIVETIQAEQDHVIRAGMNGVLVVQGGPGTGKTAVALHRAAYLLYTYRQQLAGRGVLIVGPNQTFLRYISQVLPSLAETGVLLRTVGDLFPGVRARRSEPDVVAEIKGRQVMVEVLQQAVEDRQRVPDEVVELEVENHVLRLDRALCEAARAKARRSGRPHNLARPVFARLILDELTQQLAEAIGTDPYADDPLGGDDAPGDPMILGEADLADLRAELVADPRVGALLEWMWPRLTPQRLLEELFADAAALDRVAGSLTPAERALLVRSPGGWTPADAPLLDEAAELLGEDDQLAQARLEAARRERIAYAEGALEIFEGSRSMEFEDWEGVGRESEQLLATDLLDAELLAARHEEASYLTTAQRAALDRLWAFGHIIVDEAQELCPMAWRLLMRRSPSRSMTIVGDVAQTGDLSGTRSWSDVLEPYVDDRWRLAELTVNYRTPAEIMELAAGVLASIDPDARPPRSVRSTGVSPWSETADPLAPAVVAAVERELALVGEGRIGVIVPTALQPEVADALASASMATPTDDLDARVVVLTVRASKGLEFDSVIVVDPSAIVAESPRGTNDLYVALTRATQRLGTLSR